MQSFTNLLRLMTTQYNIATLLVNTAVRSDANTQSAFSATKDKPALGASWAYSADTCILVHRLVDEDTIIVEVIRSRTGVLLLKPNTSQADRGRKWAGRLSTRVR
jgi:Rad51